jgi:OpgC protein
LIDSAAIGTLLLKFGAPLAQTRVGVRLAKLGRTSLEVFCAHLVFCFLFLGLGSGPDAQFAWWQDAIVIAVTLAGLFLLAEYVERRRSQPRGERAWLRPHVSVQKS